ncbi:hypothetical protein [Desulfogranum marinum]|uniref:hypothetical protein n=1 Tax=Desulfogranum marinum TaxID=453220 RepID=UPI0029C65B22|nr:hypothetical protein [Desulfogranum marinum]
MGEQQPFDWQRRPEVESFLLQLLADFRGNNRDLEQLEAKLKAVTSTRLFDWIDHFVVEDSLHIRTKLSEMGFVREESEPVSSYVYPGVMLPAVVFSANKFSHHPGVALRVENIADFIQFNGFNGTIEGAPLAPFRQCCVSLDNGAALYAVERRGTRAMQTVSLADGFQQQYQTGLEQWQLIPRGLVDEEQAISAIFATVDSLVRSFGPDLAAHIVCEGERRYWLSRNYAARIQKMRQDILGMGWANNDHHTFRSSRQYFTRLVDLFSRLGFTKRERFYAGKEAGWGAQVMENSTAGLSLFLDVDLAPEEVSVDFSTQPLEERDQLGTVGLWCALHGDSILKAGMHHLAVDCLFGDLVQDVEQYGVAFMAPFSDFEYLKQAFSKGEIWEVDPLRVQNLLEQKRITQEKAEQFLHKGVLGSHLENIQRRDGYKGFNKKNVNVIIKETDPRVYN